MKKIIRFFLLLLALTLLFASCEHGGEEVTQAPTSTGEVTEAVAPETSAEDTTAEVTSAVTEEVTAEVTEAITEPISEPITEPVTEPITEPVTEPVTEPITEPVTEPVTESVTEPPHEHLWGAWKVISAPSCLNEGAEERTCSCGEREQKTVAALGHKEVTDPAKAATCTASGLTEGKHCSVCKTVTVAQKTVAALGHHEVVVAGVKPTEREYGLSDKIYCKVCSVVIQDHKKLFPLGLDIASNYNSDYGYNFLGTYEKASAMQGFYKKLDELLTAFHEDVSIDIDSSMTAAIVNYSDFGLSYDEALAVYLVYKCDHPLYYWISNSWKYTSSRFYVLVSESYADGADRARYNDLIYSSVGEYLEIIEDEKSVYHTTLGLHDAIIKRADYAYEADGVTAQNDDWAHNIIGILEKGEGVCESYAELFQLILNYCDIDNVIIKGRGESGAHAWNAVELDDGKWYWFDLTWDDSSWLSGVIHTSFCVNDTQDPTERIGCWTIEGKPFISQHTAYSSETFSKNYCYAVPERSDTVFFIDDTMLYDTFIFGGIEYTVIGYDTVYCDQYRVNGVTVPEIVTYNGRTYGGIVG